MSEYGTVTAPNTVRLERVLPGPIERVWEYLTVSEKRARWLAAGEMELRVGGRVALTWDNDKLSQGEEAPEEFRCKSVSVEGRVTECEPPRLLRFTWLKDEHESEVSFELSPRGKDVAMVLTHRRLSGRDGMVGVSGGWHTHVGVLIALLRGETPTPFWSTFVRLKEEYERRIPR